MERKKMFSSPVGNNTAKNMLTGSKTKQPKEEIKEEFQKKVQEHDKKGKLDQLAEPITPTKKSNRGRKRLYADGEVIKLTVLVDTHLSHTLKVLAKNQGTTVKSIMTRYVKSWLETNHELENSYSSTKTKNYTGFAVTPDVRQKFADTCNDRELTQSYVMESLYEKAILDLKQNKK